MYTNIQQILSTYCGPVVGRGAIGNSYGMVYFMKDRVIVLLGLVSHVPAPRTEIVVEGPDNS